MVAVVSVYEQGLIRAFEDQGVKWGSRVAREVMDEAMFLCPSQGGNLRASHRVVQDRGAGGRFSAGFHVENTARYALWVHNGTGIYGPRGVPIRPVNTPMRRYLHMPPGFQPAWYWTHLRKGDFDPYGHKEEVDGEVGNAWLARAGDRVSWRHGAS